MHSLCPAALHVMGPRLACNLAAWVGRAQGRDARAQARLQREALSSDDEAPVPRRGGATGRRTSARRGSVRASRCVRLCAPLTPPPVSLAARPASCLPVVRCPQGLGFGRPRAVAAPHVMCPQPHAGALSPPCTTVAEAGHGPAAAAPRARTSQAARGTRAPQAHAARARAAPRASRRRRRPTSAMARWAVRATQPDTEWPCCQPYTLYPALSSMTLLAVRDGPNPYTLP